MQAIIAAIHPRTPPLLAEFLNRFCKVHNIKEACLWRMAAALEAKASQRHHLCRKGHYMQRYY